MLNKLLDVEGKRYTDKRDTATNKIADFDLLAPNPTNQYYSIDYIGMIPVLVEAIKEQQMAIYF